MNVLLGISPRALYVCFIREIGNVMPTFSVLLSNVVPFILVLRIVPQSCKSIALLCQKMNLLLARFFNYSYACLPHW